MVLLPSATTLATSTALAPASVFMTGLDGQLAVIGQLFVVSTRPTRAFLAFDAVVGVVAFVAALGIDGTMLLTLAVGVVFA